MKYLVITYLSHYFGLKIYIKIKTNEQFFTTISILSTIREYSNSKDLLISYFRIIYQNVIKL